MPQVAVNVEGDRLLKSIVSSMGSIYSNLAILFGYPNLALALVEDEVFISDGRENGCIGLTLKQKDSRLPKNWLYKNRNGHRRLKSEHHRLKSRLELNVNELTV